MDVFKRQDRIEEPNTLQYEIPDDMLEQLKMPSNKRIEKVKKYAGLTGRKYVENFGWALTANRGRKYCFVRGYQGYFYSLCGRYRKNEKPEVVDIVSEDFICSTCEKRYKTAIGDDINKSWVLNKGGYVKSIGFKKTKKKKKRVEEEVRYVNNLGWGRKTAGSTVYHFFREHKGYYYCFCGHYPKKNQYSEPSLVKDKNLREEEVCVQCFKRYNKQIGSDINRDWRRQSKVKIRGPVGQKIKRGPRIKLEELKPTQKVGWAFGTKSSWKYCYFVKGIDSYGRYKSLCGNHKKKPYRYHKHGVLLVSDRCKECQKKYLRMKGWKEEKEQQVQKEHLKKRRTKTQSALEVVDRLYRKEKEQRERYGTLIKYLVEGMDKEELVKVLHKLVGDGFDV